MTGTAILIAALSGRALAQSARRAGYVPLVVDAFGDMDTREAAAAVKVLRHAIVRGFEKDSLRASLDGLAAGAPVPPLGVVLGSGFEDAPDTAAAVAHHYKVLGNGAEAIRRVKDPERFFRPLHDIGVDAPETRQSPDGAHVWLRKNIGGSGGLHVRWAEEHDGAAPGVYFQHYIEGSAISALVIARPDGWSLVGLSQQWTNPTPTQHFRYGGAVGPIEAPELATQAHDIIDRLASAITLTGLISLDFIVTHHDRQLWLLEINARPGATLDVFDDESGWLVKAHLAACLSGSDPTGLTPNLTARYRVRPAGSDPIAVRAAATLYADCGSLVVPALDWPSWSADRSHPGTMIERHDPVATVIAEGETAHAAEALCRERLSTLADMLYGAGKREGAAE